MIVTSFPVEMVTVNAWVFTLSEEGYSSASYALAVGSWLLSLLPAAFDVPSTSVAADPSWLNSGFSYFIGVPPFFGFNYKLQLIA